MNCDELLLNAQEAVMSDEVSTSVMNKKEKLYSLAACGKTKQYLGTEFSIEQIQQMSSADIEKYYTRYEAQLGSKMVKSLGQTVIGLYTKLVSQFFPLDSSQDLMYDLSQDPVLTKSLESLSCDLFYRFGGLLSPVVMGLITFNHIDFMAIKNERDRESNESDRTANKPQSDSNQGNEEPRTS